MAQQSPMISIPKKTTDDVDWTTPIQVLIAQSYGERPENYATECQNLQRCRQDAVRGAGSDTTARDLLYKYFGQLELLELRFSEIKVSFPWRDAFTNKLTTQTSLAFEKASIIFMLAATHSAIGAQQNRSDPEALKRAVHYFKSAAGMLNYINENFLHAPSTDLSREVVQFLVTIMIAQATEAIFEKGVQEKKMGNPLIAKIAAQAASLYNQLNEDSRDFMGKGIFDRNWITLLQIKAKWFTSIMHYYRALADDALGKHGDALVRLTIAETNAKDANRLASTLTSYFVTTLSPNLPSDAGSSILDLTKAHLAVCSEKRKSAARDNDMIYNAVLPAEGTLAVIEKTIVAQPISIQEVYGTPTVQKTIGPDIFQRLIPLSVHEGASVYSEEKAKLVRGEVEKADIAEGDVKAGLESIGVKAGLARFREMVDNPAGADMDPIPPTVRGWREEIAGKEDVDSRLRELERLSKGVSEELNTASRELEVESRECEMMRVRYEHLWEQAPSAGLNKTLRQDLKSHFAALEQAQGSDAQCLALWNEVRADVALLTSFDGKLEACFMIDQPGPRNDLLELDTGVEASDDAEKERISALVKEIDEKLGRINKLGRERNETLKDLKEKIQTDDVSHILLLNRRGSSFEPSLFAQELEKFKPYQQRIAMSIQMQQTAVQEIAASWKILKEVAGRGPGARKWEERERRKMEVVRRFARAREGWMEVCEGLAKGIQFYRDLAHGSSDLHKSISAFVKTRNSEREDLASQAETRKRLSAPAPTPNLPPKANNDGLGGRMASLNLGPSQDLKPMASSAGGYQNWNISSPPPPPPPPQQQQQPQAAYSGFPPPPPAPDHPYSSLNGTPGLSSPPPPPPPPTTVSSPPASDPYANLFSAPGISNQFSADKPSPQPSAPPPPPQQQPSYSYYNTSLASTPYGVPVQSNYNSQPPTSGQAYGSSQPSQQPYLPPPPPQQQYSYTQHTNPSSAFPPPPPPVSYQSMNAPPRPPPPPNSPPQPGYGNTQGYYGQQQQYGGYGGYGR